MRKTRIFAIVTKLGICFKKFTAPVSFGMKILIG